jgi:hypothetical protein
VVTFPMLTGARLRVSDPLIPAKAGIQAFSAGR